MDAELAPKNKELDYRTERFLALFVAKVRNIPEAVEIYDGLGEHIRFTGKSIEKFDLEREIGVLTAVASRYDDDNDGDFKERTPIVRQAALLGSAKMQYKYSAWLRNGIGISQNDRLSFIFTLAAAQQKYAKAMMALGAMYKLGRGVEKNGWRAVEWYEKAIAEGDTDAYKLAGEGYASLVIRGHTEYADRAIELLERAIRLGNEESRVALNKVQEYLYKHDM